MLPGAMARNHPHKEKRTFAVYGNARADGRIRRQNKTPRRLDVERRRELVAILLQPSLAQIEKCVLDFDCLVFVSPFHEYGLIPWCIMD